MYLTLTIHLWQCFSILIGGQRTLAVTRRFQVLCHGIPACYPPSLRLLPRPEYGRLSCKTTEGVYFPHGSTFMITFA